MKKETVKKYASLKRCFDRGKYYSTYVQFFLSIVILINTSPDLQAMIKINWFTAGVIFAVIVICFVMVGAIDYRIGLHQAEIDNIQRIDPFVVEVRERLTNIETAVTTGLQNAPSKIENTYSTYSMWPTR